MESTFTACGGSSVCRCAESLDRGRPGFGRTIPRGRGRVTPRLRRANGLAMQSLLSRTGPDKTFPDGNEHEGREGHSNG